MTLCRALFLAIVNVFYRGLFGAALGLFVAEVVAGLLGFLEYERSKADMLGAMIDMARITTPLGITSGFALGIGVGIGIIWWHAADQMRRADKSASNSPPDGP